MERQRLWGALKKAPHLRICGRSGLLLAADEAIQHQANTGVQEPLGRLRGNGLQRDRTTVFRMHLRFPGFGNHDDLSCFSQAWEMM